MPDDIERPDPKDDERAFQIACAGKRGQYIHPDDLKWIAKLYKRYPAWATEMTGRVFDATKPYGAH